MVREGRLQVSDRQGMLYPRVSPDSSLKVSQRPPANVNPAPSPVNHDRQVSDRQ